jgi:hypothetical protein
LCSKFAFKNSTNANKYKIVPNRNNAHISLFKLYMKAQLIEKYIQFTLEHNKAPESVYLFAKAAGIDEKEFYTHFSGLNGLEAAIYKQWFDTTLEQSKASEPWNNYSAREKVLAIYYTFIENVKNHRSFAVYLKNRDFTKLPKWPAYLSELHATFKENMRPILNEAIDTKEIEARKFIDEKYVDALWLNFLFVLTFWLNDDSQAFEKSDEAIEKSVNLAFDLMGKSALDAALDFGKFLFQAKR